MLEVVFDVKSGTVSSIPDEPHHFTIKNAKKLTSSQYQLLKQYIIKHRLDVSFNHSVSSTKGKSERLSHYLTQFVAESMQHAPRKRETMLGWLIILMMFAFPIYIAYHFSDWLQSNVVTQVLSHIANGVIFQNEWLHHIFFGDYGVLSLGTYSLVWALPVVILISCSTAFIEHTHIKDYVIWSIEPSMKRIGLEAIDIVPVLEGFGCNAAAVLQADQQCNACTKTNCISMISFGSACSYQIGATLSIMNTAHISWLFMPYLVMLFIGGIVHNYLWQRLSRNPIQTGLQVTPSIHVARPIQWPSWHIFSAQVMAQIKMFLYQAMPIFIAICFIVSLLSLTPLLYGLSQIFTPILMLLHIPTELSPGILFSMIRKDGMLLFNVQNGHLLQSLSALQVLALLFFSSTFTACSVTITMMIRRLGFGEGFKIVGKQMVTSLCCLIVLAAIVGLSQLFI
ncbi:nucleoside recognition domain-containing protein [Staphylococcus canis]|uniref:Ferrous iron transporter B n=1 Tax=Staphylococcus canis TaxID=2724942 RepID=A0ABS0TA61_9STAP|nr:ferrous iron transporter B [Staphylococcus canis]MBI5974856.1 ferrous iron transporter B [Staphylococcus canis]